MKQHLFHVTRHVSVRICLLTAVLLLALFTMSKPVQAAPKIYWIEPSLGAMRTDPDGTNLESLGIGAGSDIALDTRASKIYRTEFSDGALIYRMNQDGSDFETVIDLDLDSLIDDIALDLTAGKIYWVFGRRLIQRANLDGSAIEDLVILPYGSRAYGLALDPIAGKMYWTDQETQTIHRANLDGTSREDVYELGSNMEPYDIALDVRAGKMYWTARSDSHGYIYRANLDGSDHEQLVAESNMEPGAIALDIGNGKIIWVDERTWTDSSGNLHGGALHRADLDGDNQETLVDDFLWDDSTGAIPTGLVVVDMPVQAAAQLYWVDREYREIEGVWGSDMRIRRGNLDGGNSETLIATHYADDPMPTGAIAVDSIMTGKMYWGDEDGIQRANLDGSEIEDLIPTTDPPEAIALDIVDQKIYWTQSDRIQRANLDGTDREDVLTGLNEPCDLALDLLAGKIYWVDAAGAVRRANLDGTDEHLVHNYGWVVKRIALDAQADVMYMIAEPAGSVPDSAASVYKMLQVYGYSGFDYTNVELFDLDLSFSYIDNADVVLDLNNSQIYWTEPHIGEIWRSNLDGTDRETARDVGGVRNPRGIALGANVSLLAFPKMYWTDYRTGTIQRANPDGTDVEFLVTTGLTHPIGIALDRSTGKMYWANYHSPLSEAKIQRADLNGLNVETLVSAGVSGPRGIALDLDAGKMYWTEHITERIRRANLDGSVQETLVNDLPSPVSIALDLDAGKMYWTDNDAGTIQRADLEGTNVEDLVTDLSTPSGITLDVHAGKMYWTDYGSGKIQRANLDGSGVEDLIMGLGEDLAFLALDIGAGKMYWATYDSGRIERANLDGSDPETVVEVGGNNTYGIALLVLPPTIPWMHSPSTSAIQNAVDQMGDTPQIDVYPGDVFSYLITATNLFDQAMFLNIYNALDEYLEYMAGTFTINGATTSDEFFADGILDYQYPALVNPGQTLEFEFDVIVQDLAPHDWMIGNTALITFSLDRPNFPGYAVTFETNRVEVRVENPIPEPSTCLFLATGLLVLLALESRRRNTRT